MRIEGLYRYPVKGLTAEALDEARLQPRECILHDRRFALVQGDAPFDPAAPAWLHKSNFACLMANARLALLHSSFDPRTEVLAIRPPDGPPLVAETRSPQGRALIGEFLTAWLGPEARGTPRFLEVPGHSFCDQKGKVVSLINLASLRALERAAGFRLDPLRFRANVYFTGAAPWAEFDWVGQEIQLGRARLRVLKRTVRCPATEVNPETAERDARPVAWLRQHFGHADLGVHAEVVEGGTIAPGDALEPLGAD